MALGQSMTKKRVAILISGRGSNMMALVEAARRGDFPAEIGAVISNRADAAGLAWAKGQEIESRVVDHKGCASREAFEAALGEVLAGVRAELVCLAGFMRLMTAGFVDQWMGRMLNVHPSLLPAFRGLHTHEQALAAGVRVTGCTVHFVTAEMDAGPIIAQAAVPVIDSDTADSLAARVLAAEHKLYPHALGLVASGSARLENGRVIHSAAINHGDSLFSPPLALTE
jgi:phosphoribosylglycinamide formyltransferase 1